MFSKLLLLASLAATAVFADPTPSAPGPGDSFNQGSDCKIGWTPDNTGAWTTMNIELMTGDNFNMKHLTTVTTVDGTKTSSFTWKCPAVVPNSAIYFYQFTSPASNVTLWTTRFGIASTDGHLDAPAQTTQPDGAAIPWGVGALADPSTATPPPSGSSSNSTSSGSAVASGSAAGSASGSSAQTVVSLSSTVSPSGFSTSASSHATSTSSHSTSASSAKSSGSTAPTNGAAAANTAVGGFEGGVVKVVVALAGVAAAFVVGL
ncbi:hypothetical protein BDY19DRAFT_931213 [Irpex rosettiformis]|uniref:Uncharacterized protein n=1 Tax=Irpex rosettiformis TaxID=378272 RepID=A0ACB8UB16_9APHY|nr:hypothetical protein BDY19DRAFT_931213 [Irpex rosettiformis]